MKVYFISGLGANKRSFEFLDVSWCEPVFIDWIKPHKKESLPEYALRLRAEIKEESPTIVGVSFGGMLVTEMAKADKSIKAIIISSNKTSTEFPGYLRMWKYLPVYKLLTPKIVKYSKPITTLVMGPQGTLQKKTFAAIMGETDAYFTAWAIEAILHWNNIDVPENLIHIHGSHDRLLPIRFVTPNVIIPSGKHIMIMDKAVEISKELKRMIVKD